VKRRSAFGYLILAPQALLLLLTFGVPLVFLGRLTFARTDFIGWEWVGLDNFIALVQDPVFWKAMANTGLYELFIVPIQIVSSLIVALLAYDLGRGVRSYLRVVLYLPILTGGLIISTVWRWIWHPSSGIANYILGIVGLEPVWWLGGRLSGIFAISCNIMLSGLGFNAMIMMAAILSVPKELMDAASIDGAGPWGIRWLIITPVIFPTVALISTLSILGVSQMWETVMMTTNGGPDHGTTTLMFDIYETGFLKGQFGSAAAKTVILVALVLALALVKNRIEAWRR
jgi:ABC-type sugar transport system permease subunit